jgi:hypothetical protein
VGPDLLALRLRVGRVLISLCMFLMSLYISLYDSQLTSQALDLGAQHFRDHPVEGGIGEQVLLALLGVPTTTDVAVIASEPDLI